MLLAGFLFACMNVSVKLIPHIPAIEIILFRSVLSFGITFFWLKKQKIPVLGTRRRLLLLRGLAGSVGLIFFFYSLQRIPLASAVTINYIAPILTSVLGIWVVKERLAPKQFFFFGLSFAGVLLIQGFDPRISLMDLAIGLIATIGMAVAYNVIRLIKGSEHPLVIMFYFPLVTIPIAGLLSYFLWVPPTGWDWAILLAIGLLTQFAQYFMTLAYQHGNLSKISSLTYISIVYALGFGFLVFGETYKLITYVGMGMVLLGVLLTVKK
ncbi:hypothetical protein A3SI_08981 [Nitritalea halalkaliphila LW7]|uniref:EamA domain-containing protein n=1 Tax=Nitritalea halalkaliphila LW7 TaxID=1189621 RepID=I5C4R2_9BACT|nr:DMT family transporter [Nitritalea halalkaliphila]EIM76814.1 hypothetical protein A3SI_08981 [Nitritalea halalkaliphila LW7]